MLKQWSKQLKTLSGNLTTNEFMPRFIIDQLLQEDARLKNQIVFEEVTFPKFAGPLSSIKGLNILAGLQKINQDDCLTVFRAIRFPTFKRMHQAVALSGYAISNYEQERILHLYRDRKYFQKRRRIQQDQRFWVQPQERVVRGLPLFGLVNDALQIHRAFRGEDDQVVIVVVHLPYTLIEDKKIKLIANAGFDADYHNTGRDFEIKNLVKNGQVYEFNYAWLRACGVDLYEIYAQGLPWTISEAQLMGIEQKFFLVHVCKINDRSSLNGLLEQEDLLKNNQFFLHGFFGDQNIFGRRGTEYLPYKCQAIKIKAPTQ